MAHRWTQNQMKVVAAEERAGLGLGIFERLNPHDLAREHGIDIYPIDQLPDKYCSQQAVTHFETNRPKVWSAALVPIGSARIILVNTGHPAVRQCSSVAHEMSHYLLEHEFDSILLSDEGCLNRDRAKEKEADFLAGELLIPYKAALKAAFAEKTNEELAVYYGVSPQFAQMCMKGARVHAQRALARQAKSGRA